MKLCSKCNLEKPLSEFNKNRNSKDGHAAWCKICNKEYMKKYNSENKEKHKEYLKEYNKQNADKRREYNQKYYKENRDVLLKRQKEYDVVNHEHKLEYMRGYYHKNKERINEYNKKYHIGYYIKNKEKIQEYKKEYSKTDKSKFIHKIKHSKRRAQMEATNVKDVITQKQWETIIYEQNKRCAMCKCLFNENRVPTMDHIVPLSRGGLNSSDNIQALCGSCNSKKNNRLDYGLIQTWIYG